ncbi:hypothetical protein, partial [Pseudomonas syringae]|uniref:hypothetical protein n=1 Tax=Pseudomonas syringae TaxID=317 RepID=UPI001E591D21
PEPLIAYAFRGFVCLLGKSLLLLGHIGWPLSKTHLEFLCFAGEHGYDACLINRRFLNADVVEAS